MVPFFKKSAIRWACSASCSTDLRGWSSWAPAMRSTSPMGSTAWPSCRWCWWARPWACLPTSPAARSTASTCCFRTFPGLRRVAGVLRAMAGAGLAFLWFNTHPAQVFMGDVGALALGGALGTIAVIVRQEIVLASWAASFVAEALSVMLQVSWFKYTKKKYGVGRRISQDGAAAPPLRKAGLGRDAGGDPLLDHHHAAVPGRPVDTETQMNPDDPLAQIPEPMPLQEGGVELKMPQLRQRQETGRQRALRRSRRSPHSGRGTRSRALCLPVSRIPPCKVRTS
jgi:hypothetical protein